jgi:hypothetical protein
MFPQVDLRKTALSQETRETIVAQVLSNPIRHGWTPYLFVWEEKMAAKSLLSLTT